LDATIYNWVAPVPYPNDGNDYLWDEQTLSMGNILMGTPMTYISGNTGTYQSGTFNKGTIALNLNPTSLGSGNNWYNGVDVTATQYLNLF